MLMGKVPSRGSHYNRSSCPRYYSRHEPLSILIEYHPESSKPPKQIWPAVVPIQTYPRRFSSLYRFVTLFPSRAILLRGPSTLERVEWVIDLIQGSFECVSHWFELTQRSVSDIIIAELLYVLSNSI
ncbi:hypothetical protein M758_5G181400 [Ceratodon purpureus]|uniref:Uncharacterized protein n=1 Tax=Ceratodon purpureus TaxID=3225 RepID=A0A8T0I5A3_CERPU|nr:hypothetical protein KC19_5G188600 [Ceratodon purpureus]KAG0617321.1 hypothetical protein M758_5G181400 [Ceratodon purpureus]